MSLKNGKAPRKYLLLWGLLIATGATLGPMQLIRAVEKNLNLIAGEDQD